MSQQICICRYVGCTRGTIDQCTVAGLRRQQDCRVGTARAVGRNCQTVCTTFMFSQCLIFVYIYVKNCQFYRVNGLVL